MHGRGTKKRFLLFGKFHVWYSTNFGSKKCVLKFWQKTKPIYGVNSYTYPISVLGVHSDHRKTYNFEFIIMLINYLAAKQIITLIYFELQVQLMYFYKYLIISHKITSNPATLIIAKNIPFTNSGNKQIQLFQHV